MKDRTERNSSKERSIKGGEGEGMKDVMERLIGEDLDQGKRN
jgi:hypothetical protein